MVIFNRIIIGYQNEIERLKPIVREAYRSIHRYQLERTPPLEQQLREAIGLAMPILEVFIAHLSAYKSSYIQVLARQELLAPTDVIMCFDRAIYELHLYAALGSEIGKLAHEPPWSKELRALLNERHRFEVRPRGIGNYHLQPNIHSLFYSCGFQN